MITSHVSFVHNADKLVCNVTYSELICYSLKDKYHKWASELGNCKSICS